MFKKNLVKTFCIILLAAFLFSLASCGKKEDTVKEKTSQTAEETEKKPFGVSANIDRDEKFDSAILSLTEDDFRDAGFSFGDSFDVVFSNGYTLTDVPYFNGYYVKTGEPVIVAYPKNDYVLITKNNRGIWTDAELSSDFTVEITLNTAGKYLATYEALGQDYSMDRDSYDTDAEFANFRAMSGGNLKENFLYRGASPVDNSRNRASYANALIAEKEIKCVIDLADSEDDMNQYISSDTFTSGYAKKLYENGKIALLSMGSNYESDAYKTSVVNGLRLFIENGGPVYIHCMEGKDRTGFVCMLIEALAGASYDEMCSDYMKTYANYYKITEKGTPEKYNAVVNLYFNTFAEYLYGSEDIEELKKADYTESARKYLSEGGMTEREINQLVDLITK